MINSMANKKIENLSDWTRFIILFIFGVILMAPFIWMVSVGFDRTANVTMPFPPRF